MDAFLLDRSALRDRVIGVIDTIRVLPAIDGDAVAAIGFCTGGRRGAGIRAHRAQRRLAAARLRAPFMATFANAPERGIQYDETTYRRAWASLVDFLDEAFDI